MSTRITRNNFQEIMFMIDEHGACKLTRTGTKVKVSPFNYQKIFEGKSWDCLNIIDDVDLNSIMSFEDDKCIIYKSKGELWVVWDL